MTINKTLIKNNSLKNYPCPYCSTGILYKKEKFLIKENGLSNPQRNLVTYPSIEYTFASLLECNICGEPVAVNGNVERSIYETEDGSKEELTFHPKSFYPPLIFFPISLKYPIEIRIKLKSSFSLYWVNLSSCANMIRVIIELILNNRKIKKTIFSKKWKKRIRLSLHKRILIFEETNPDNAKLLLAMKWIGNFGSHLEKLKEDDILLAFELLEQVLENIYIKKPKKLLSISNKINRKKKPLN